MKMFLEKLLKLLMKEFLIQMNKKKREKNKKKLSMKREKNKKKLSMKRNKKN